MITLLHLLADTSIQPGSLPNVDTGNNSQTIPTVLSIVFAIAGALALLMITVSGLRYITSAGNPERTAKARNGIIYALVGLAIAVSAEAIVTFIINGLP
jgi:Type IV secretion system pilin